MDLLPHPPRPLPLPKDRPVNGATTKNFVGIHLVSSHPSDTPLDRGRPLMEHLGELRSRLIWSAIAVGAMVAPGWFLSQKLIEQMAQVTGPMVYLAPTEAFAVRLKLAMILGLVLGAPFVIYHLWRFVGVALTVSERRVVLGALPLSYLLFSIGSGLGWFLIVPAGLRFLLGFASDTLRPTLSVEACVGFGLWTSFGLGVLFQLPVVLGALAHWGFVRSATLAHYRRHAILIILIVAAILTPGPDIFSQLLLAGPTYALFEISVVLARFLEP
jgi:sec-independent protein translocase protein TatC